MRRIVSVLSLAVVIGAVPAWAHDPDRSGNPETRLRTQPVAAETEHEGYLASIRNTLSAIARLRLRPGHDAFDRSTIARQR